MLRKLDFANFKCWKHVKKMRLAPLTGLFGTNSSGKTSILQLLLMLKQTVDSPDRSQVLNLGADQSLTELGTFRDVAHGHDVANPLELRLGWELRDPLTVSDPSGARRQALFCGNEMEFCVQVSQGKGGRLTCDSMTYSFSAHSFTLRKKEAEPSKYILSVSPQDFCFKRTVGRPWHLPAPAKCYGFPDQVRNYFRNAAFLSDFELAFESLFRRTFYLGPLRDYPQREYSWAGEQPADMGRSGEKSVNAILASRLRPKIGRGRGCERFSVEQYVAYWLRKLKMVSSFRVEELSKNSNLYRVYVRKTPKTPEVLLTDVGFGVSQLLPVIVLCYYVPEGSIVILEQPEIHLHPSAQVGLADIFIDAIDKRGIQIIVESHSEHLLRRLQRRIAEERLDPENTALYFCDVDGGKSRLSELEIDMYGNIENWPRDFFGDAFAESAAMAEAALARRGEKGA